MLIKGSVTAASVNFLSPDDADCMLAIEALFSAIRTIPAEVSDPGVALAKLAWWQNELQPVVALKSQHPLVLALNSTGMIEHVQGDHWVDYLAATAASIDPAPSNDQSGLLQYLKDLYGRECVLMVNETRPVQPDHALLGIGAAFGMLERVQALLSDSDNLEWLSMDLVARHQVQTGESAASMSAEKKMNLAKDLASMGLEELGSINSEWLKEQSQYCSAPGVRFAALRSALTSRRLKMIQKDPARYAASLGRSSIAETFAAWSAARQAAGWFIKRKPQ